MVLWCFGFVGALVPNMIGVPQNPAYDPDFDCPNEARNPF